MVAKALVYLMTQEISRDKERSGFYRRGHGPREMRDFEFVWTIKGTAEYRWGQNTVIYPQSSTVLCKPGTTNFSR